MAPTNLSHRRTHNLLLISKLLSLRDTVSPLTLLVDSLEQPARPLIQEYIRRAKVRNYNYSVISGILRAIYLCLCFNHCFLCLPLRLELSAIANATTPLLFTLILDGLYRSLISPFRVYFTSQD